MHSANVLAIGPVIYDHQNNKNICASKKIEFKPGEDLNVSEIGGIKLVVSWVIAFISLSLRCYK